MEGNNNLLIQNYESAVIDLLSTKPFFAKFIMSMKKDFNFKMPTCGVSVRSTGFTLHINADMFNILSRSERVAVLIHEILHVVHMHPLRFKQFGIQDHNIANAACDIAINQFIQGLPQTIKYTAPDGEVVEGHPITYEILKKEIPGLEPKMSGEYYFNQIKQEQQKRTGQNNGEGMSEYILSDSHDEWKNTDLTPEQEEKMVKGHVKAILESCSDQERQVLDKTIIDEFYKSDVNWKSQLRSFFANSEETFTITTRKKRNRRYGILQAGHKNESKLNLSICVDTSGSISDEQLKMFFGEVDRIYDENHMILHVIEADCVVRNFYKYKKHMKIEVSGRSGTAYQPAITKAKELKSDCILYMGDFDTSDQPVNPKVPFLWVGCSDQVPPTSWGRVIRLK